MFRHKKTAYTLYASWIF